MLCEIGHDWTDSNYRDVFSKVVFGTSAAEYLELGTMPEIRKKRRYIIDPEVQAERLKAQAEQHAMNMLRAKQLAERLGIHDDAKKELIEA